MSTGDVMGVGESDCESDRWELFLTEDLQYVLVVNEFGELGGRG